ncbi:acetyltransferase [Streptomyces viridochromogenes DSM 40736]|uniref:Acetyltransferase n=1 Tax=Streptomyces viridochromogenes (strain DSM 40736 / JCM 4977 / BCRC 1201 / Tue 494) TaxID=591159 RepID=D9WXH2_STRVT|nr:GNAT family N-acetyltransferase [Streptomyces viridochromogenes]EFL30985.1 acetyltransferase [Streptomyces viridochromogenes DSM 40736]
MPFLIDPVLTAGTLAGRPQPTLPTGDGLLIRPWRASDASAVYEVFQDPVIHQWHARSADSEAEAGGWINDWHRAWEEEREAQWAVVDTRSDSLLGRVALREIRLDDGGAEVAYWTAPAARGRGVAARAATALTRWALDEVGFHRLELLHAVRNEASCRVATRTGFALEGTKRSAVLHADGWHDMHLHARVRGD